MARTVVVLLAGLGAAISVLASLVHGSLLVVAAAAAFLAAAMSAHLQLPSKKNQSGHTCETFG